MFWLPEASFRRYQNNLSHWAAADETRPVPSGLFSFVRHGDPGVNCKLQFLERAQHASATEPWRVSAATRGGRRRFYQAIFQESNSNFQFPIRKTLIVKVSDVKSDRKEAARENGT